MCLTISIICFHSIVYFCELQTAQQKAGGVQACNADTCESMMKEEWLNEIHMNEVSLKCN